MVKGLRKLMALMCTAAFVVGSLHTPVSAASKKSGDDFESVSATRAAEIEKYGGEEKGGLVCYELDEILDEDADEMTYEVFAKNTLGTLDEESAEKAGYKDIVVKRDWYSYGSKYMYNQLNSKEKALYNKLYQYCLYFLTNANTNSKIETNYKIYNLRVNGLYKQECISSAFSYAGLSADRAKEIFMIFDYENPQFYFLDAAYYMSTTKSCLYITFYDRFRDSVSRAGVTNSTFSTIDSYAAIVNTMGSDEAKARKAEELVMAKNKYAYSMQIPGGNYQEYYDQSLYSTFNLGYTVCAGYAKGVNSILRKAGMSAMSVTSSNHAWNLVKVNGNWYNLDATWDDSDSGIFSKTFFLKSDSFMTSNDKCDQYGMPAHRRTSEWNGAPSCMADYGTAWPSNYANINSHVDAADAQNASIKSNFNKVYTPKLLKGNVSVKLSKKNYEYDGTVKTPKITVKMGGQTLSAAEYNVKYAKGRKDPGVYKVTVSLKSATGYKGSKTVKFTILPKKTSIKKVTNSSKGVKLTWSRGKGKISGYQIQISPVKNFSSGVKSLSLKKPSVTSKNLTTLESGKTYYFRIRTYKANGSGVAYSKWSKTRGLKVR